MATLLIDLGEVRAVSLRDGQSIGRESGRDIVIAHPTVSREHARIDLVDGRYVLSDLASRNGTRVNGKAVLDNTPLPDGARLRIGHVRAWFFEQLPRRLPRASARKAEGIVFNCVCGQRLWSAADTVGMSVVCSGCGQAIEIPPPSENPPPVDLGGTVAGVKVENESETDKRAACGVCQWPIEDGEPKQVCPSCNTPFHIDCWTENKGCATYGCPQVNALAPKVPAAALDAADFSINASASLAGVPGRVSTAADAAPSSSAATPGPVAASEQLGTSWPHMLLGLSVLGSLVGLLSFGIPAATVGVIALVRLMITRAGGRGILFGAVLIAALGAYIGYRVSGLWWWDRPLF